MHAAGLLELEMRPSEAEARKGLIWHPPVSHTGGAEGRAAVRDTSPPVPDMKPAEEWKLDPIKPKRKRRRK